MVSGSLYTYVHHLPREINAESDERRQHDSDVSKKEAQVDYHLLSDMSAAASRMNARLGAALLRRGSQRAMSTAPRDPSMSGCLVNLVTPFKPGTTEIDYDTLASTTERQVSAGVSGVIPLGTTGAYRFFAA